MPTIKRLLTCYALILIICCFIGINDAAAQQTNKTAPDFQSVPSQLQSKYHFNFPRTFYSDEAAVTADIVKVREQVATLEKLKGNLTTSANNLLNGLQLIDEISPRQAKVDIYYYLRYSVNTEATDLLEKRQQLSAEIEPRLSFVRDELIKLDDETLARFIKEQPALERYRFAIERTRRFRPHVLPLAQEQVLAATKDAMTAWTEELYQRAIDRVTFGEVKDARGQVLQVLQDEQTIANSNDRNARAEGFKKYYGGYANSRDLFAFALIKSINNRNQLAKMRGYENYPDQVFFESYLNREQVENVYRQLANAGELSRQYQRVRLARIQQQMGYQQVNYWDLNAVPTNFERPRFDVLQSTEIIKQSLKPLGNEYDKELQELFNPDNGRLDIVGGSNRTPGAFAWGYPPVAPMVFYAYNYEGFTDDLLTLVHEAGHVVHYQLIGNNRVIPAYSDGPGYFTEAFAMLNELVVADYLYKNETDPEKKIYYLEEFLANAMRLFRIASDAALEYEMYQGVAKGELKKPEDLDALTKKINGQFSIWYDKHDELKNRWNTLPHYYRSPMYYVNYVFANLLALKFYELYNRDQQNFVPNYLALMRNGFDNSPQALLEKFLKIDLGDPKLIEGGLAIIAERTRELERLYTASNRQPQQNAKGAK